MTQSIFDQHDILDQLFVELKRIYQAGQAPHYDTLRHIAPTLTYAEYELVIERFVSYVRSHEWQQLKEHEDKLKQAQPTWPQDLMADALNFEQDLVRSLGRFLKEREQKLSQAMSARVKEFELLTQDLQAQLQESNAQRHQQQDELMRYNAAIERLKAVYNTQRAFMSQGQHDSEALELISQVLQGNEQGVSPELKAISVKLSSEAKNMFLALVQAAKQQANTSGHRAPALPDIDDLLRAPQLPAAKPHKVDTAPVVQAAPAAQGAPAVPTTQATPAVPTAQAAPAAQGAPVTQAAPARAVSEQAAPASHSYQEVFALITQTSTDYLNSKSDDQDLTSLDLEEIGNKLIAHPLVVQAKLSEAQLKRLIIKSVFLYTEPLTQADLSASDEELVATLPSEQDKFFARGMLTFAHLGGTKSEATLSPATAIALSAPLKDSPKTSPKASPMTAALLERPVSAATAIVRSNRSAETLSRNSAQEITPQAPLIDLTQSDLLAEGLAPADALEQLKEQQAAQLQAKAQAKADALNQGASLALGPEGKTPLFSEPAELLNSVTPKALPRDEGTLLQDMAQSQGADSIAAFAAASAKLESLAPMLHEASRDLNQAKAEFDAALGLPQAPKAQAETKASASSFWAQNMSDIWAGTEGGANVGAKAGTESNTTSAIASVAQDVLKVAAKLERDTDEKLKQEKKQSLFANSYFTGGALNEPSNEPVNSSDDDFIAGNASDAEQPAPKSMVVPVSPAADGAAKEHPRTNAPITAAAQRSETAPALGAAPGTQQVAPAASVPVASQSTPQFVPAAAVKQDLSQHTSIIINHDALKHQQAGSKDKIALKSLSGNTAIVRSQAPQNHAPTESKPVVPAPGAAAQQLAARAQSTEHTTIVRGPAPNIATMAASATAAASAAASTATLAQAAAAGAVATGVAAASAVATGVAAASAVGSATDAAHACLQELGTLVDLKLKQRMSMLNQLLGPGQDGGAAVGLKSLSHFYENCIAGLTQQFKLSSDLTQALKARMERDLNDPSHQGEQRIKALGPVSEELVTASLKQALSELSAHTASSTEPSSVTSSAMPDAAPGAMPGETLDAAPSATPGATAVDAAATRAAEAQVQAPVVTAQSATPTAKSETPQALEGPALGAGMRLLTEDETRDAEYQAHPIHRLNTFVVVDDAMSYEESLAQHQTIDNRVNRGLIKKVNPKKLEALREKRLKQEQARGPGAPRPFSQLDFSSIIETQLQLMREQERKEQQNPELKEQNKNAPGMVFFAKLNDSGEAVIQGLEGLPDAPSSSSSAPATSFTLVEDDGSDSAEPSAEPNSEHKAELSAAPNAEHHTTAAPNNVLILMPTPSDEDASVQPKLEAPVVPQWPTTQASTPKHEALVMAQLPDYEAPANKLEAQAVPEHSQSVPPLKAPVMAQLPAYVPPLKAPVMAQLPAYIPPLKAPVMAQLPAYFAPLKAPVVPQLPAYVPPLKAPVMAQLPAYVPPLKAPVVPQLPAYVQPLKAPVVPELAAYVAPLNAPVMAQLPTYGAAEPVTATVAEPDTQVAPAISEQTAPQVAPAVVASQVDVASQVKADDEEDDGLLITPASAYATPSGAASDNPLNLNEANTLWPNSMSSYSFSFRPTNGAAILGGALGSGFGTGSNSGSGQ